METTAAMRMSQAGNDSLNRYFEKRSDLINRMAEDPSGLSIIEWYDEEAKLYDEQFKNADFQYHKTVVDILNQVAAESKDGKILDIAAGSGVLGALLRENGFTDIDAIDGSVSMLRLAKEKNVYNNIFQHMIGKEKIPQIADGSYDAASCGGSVAKGHLTFDTIPTMLRTIRPGGYLVFSCAEWNFQFEDFSRKRLELVLSDLMRKGLCKNSETKSSFHRDQEPTDIFILQRGDAEL